MSPDSFPGLDRFKRILLEDFEYRQFAGGRPRPVCRTTMDLRTGQVEREWLWDNPSPSPFDLTDHDLYISYHLPAELCCLLVLGWPMPPNAIDLCVEYKLLRNGHPREKDWDKDRKDDQKDVRKDGRSLVACLIHHKIDAAEFVDKEEMQGLAMRGGAFTEQE